MPDHGETTEVFWQAYKERRIRAAMVFFGCVLGLFLLGGDSLRQK